MKIQRDTLLGLVFFGGLALVGWATVNLSRVSLEPKPTVVVYFDHAQGLRVGDPVYVLGTRYGRVIEVALNQVPDHAPIRVTLELDQELPELHADRVIRIRQASLLGGSQIDIDPGTAGERAPGQPLRGETHLSALDALGEADIIGTVASFKRFFDKLSDPSSSIGALLESREAYDDFSAILKSARRTMESIEGGRGPLGRVIQSEEMAEDLSATLAAIREIAEATQRGEGVLGRLIMDSGLGASIAETIESLKSSASKLDDPASGTLGALLADPQLRTDVAAIAANLAEATSKLTQGEGLMARLLNDPELGRQLTRLFKQIAGAIEDAREAAPVGTFFQVLTAPF